MKRAALFSTRRARGFSIVELMVSVVVGMLALMFATRMIGNSEQNKQTALGGSDAMQNGVAAMFSISNDASAAGFGVNDPLLAGCDTTMADNGGTGYHLATATRAGASITPLSPAIIVSHGNDPDEITFYAGTGMSGSASVRLTLPYTGGSTVAVDHPPFGFQENDVIVVAPELPGTKCSLVQLSATPAPAAVNLRFDSGGGRRFNNAGVLNNQFTARARVFNLGPVGALSFHTWTVSNGFLQLTATDLAGSEVTPASVTDNIVSIKAQYGFDNRTGAAFTPENGTQVNQWSPTMLDVDGVDGAGSAGDYQHIAAVRLAVVARSKTPERPAAGSTCTASVTAAAPTVFGGSVTVNVAVPNDPTDWHCYRYRVFETIVPIRNTAWRPTAWPK